MNVLDNIPKYPWMFDVKNVDVGSNISYHFCKQSSNKPNNAHYNLFIVNF